MRMIVVMLNLISRDLLQKVRMNNTTVTVDNNVCGGYYIHNFNSINGPASSAIIFSCTAC